MAQKFLKSKVYSDRLSTKSLTRVNPKLSGNVKITIDSKNDVSLNTLNADDILSKSIYKKYMVTDTSTYARDLYNAFKDIPTTSMFKVFQKNDATRILNNINSQYDMFYSCGCESLISKLYDESLSYLAPLYINETIPQNFIIIKIPKGLSKSQKRNVTFLKPNNTYLVYSDTSQFFRVKYNNIVYTVGETFTTTTTQLSYIIDNGEGLVLDTNENSYDSELDTNSDFYENFWKHGEVIKTFDLSEKSKIGKYLRDSIEASEYPESPLSFSFNSNVNTTFNGVDYTKGIYTQKSDNLIMNNEKSIIEFEKEVINGFERNSVIASHIFNLEFLFDDDSSLDFELNRYIGLYVDKNIMNQFKLDYTTLAKYYDSSTQLNTNNILNDYIDIEALQKLTPQTDADGVKLFINTSNLLLPNTSEIEQNRMFYVEDKFGNIYTQKTYDESNIIIPKSDHILLKNKSVELSDFTGVDEVILQDKCELLESHGRGSIVIKIKEQPLLRDIMCIKSDIHNVPVTSIEYGHFYYVKNRFGNETDTLSYHGANAETGFIPLSSLLGNFDSLGGFGEGLEITADFELGIGNNITIVGTASAYLSDLIDNWNALNPNNTATLNEINAIGYKPAYGETFTLSGGSDSMQYSNGDVFVGEYQFPNLFDGTTSKDDFHVIECNGVLCNTGGNTEFYLHQGIETKNEIAISVANALNEYEYRTYVAVAVNDRIVINSRLNGYDIKNTELIFNTNIYDTTAWYEVEYGETVLESDKRFKFVGQTRYDNNRIVVSHDNIDLVGDILDNGWMKMKNQFKVFSPTNPSSDKEYKKVVHIAPYLERPVYNEFNEVIDYEFINDKFIITVDCKYYDISLNNQNRFDIRRLNNINHGILSFYNIEDFDFDFHTSTYGKSPYYEMFKYLDTLENEPLIYNYDYIVVSDKSTSDSTISLYDGVSPNPIIKSVGSFFTITNNTSYYTKNGNSDIRLVLNIYSNDFDINQFEGFFSLFKDDRDVTISVTDYTKHFANNLQNEYSKLNENFLKEYAVESRVVPYISKWNYKGGIDSRDNPYRLNQSRVFGKQNLSPDMNNISRSPSSLTHEWFYIDNIPLNYSNDYFTKLDNYYGYFDIKLTDNILYDSSTDRNLNLLEDFFTVNSLNGQTIEKQERYSEIIFNSNLNVTETLFKGFKFRLKNTTNVVGDILNDNSQYDGYKFSCVLSLKQRDFTEIGSPITFRIVENVPQKFIIVKIDLFIEDYKLIDINDNIINIDFIDGTASQFNYRKTKKPPAITDSLVYYRNGVEYLDYAFLYFAKDSRFIDGQLDVPPSAPYLSYSNIKTSFINNIGLPSSLDGATNKIIPTLSTKINLNVDEEILPIRPNINSHILTIDVTNDSIYVFDAISDIKKTSYMSTDFQLYGNWISSGATPPTSLSLTVPFLYPNFWSDKVSVYKNGGKNYLQKILPKISLGNFNNILTNDLSKIDRIKVDTDGNITESKLEFEIIPYDSYTQSKGLEYVRDDIKPTPLNIHPNIGYKTSSIDSTQILNRYSGVYEPSFNKVMFCNTNDEITSLLNGSVDTINLNGLNTKFDVDNPYFGFIQNFYYHKVSEKSDLLLLSESEDPSLYPFINEIAIGRKPFNVFKSNWDDAYYNIYTTNIYNNSLKGTRNMNEFKTFLASKVMKIPSEIVVEKFVVGGTSLIDSSSNNFDDGGKFGNVIEETIDTDISEVSGVSTTIDLTLTIDLQKRLIRYFIENNIANAFDDLVELFSSGLTTTIEDDIETYIINNILNRYTIADIKVYIKENDFNTFNFDSTNIELLQQGYSRVKNFTLTNNSNFNKTLVYTKNTINTSIGVTFDIELI